jgi:hypothetical protein
LIFILVNIPESNRILHVDASGGLVKIDKSQRDYGQILNYVFLLKDLSNSERPGMTVSEVASSRHDTFAIGESLRLLRYNFNTIYPKKNLNFRLVCSDLSWATIHATLEALNTENVYTYMNKTYYADKQSASIFISKTTNNKNAMEICVVLNSYNFSQILGKNE